MADKQKLELTWFGKEKKIKVEPRILIEDKEKSNVKNDPDTENMIIHGDNLLALKALESKYAGQVKCIYIDPPYNTGYAFKHFDDNLEHSIWLGLMKERLALLKTLLSDDGVIFISIDDDESHYLKVLMDEIFGRNNYCGTFIWEKKKKPSYLSNMGIITEYILSYSKDKKSSPPFLFGKTTEGKKYPINNSGNGVRIIKFPPNTVSFSMKDQIVNAQDMSQGNIITRLIKDLIIENGKNKNELILEGEWRYSQETLNEYIKNNEEFSISKIPFRPNHIKLGNEDKKMKNLLSIAHYNMSTNEDATKESEALFGHEDSFDNPKPEKLIETLICAVTNEGDLVLDSFLGSGTTAAVAQKMNRRYIGIEMGDHAYTHCKVRLDKVISGEDKGGISVSKEHYDLNEDDLKDLDLDIEDVKTFNKILNKIGKETDLIPKDVLKEIKRKTKTLKIKSELKWKGGGAYKFYELAPTLINKDDFDEYVINKDYDADMLAAAVALHEGFDYRPDTECFWKQAKANEKSYLFVTTRYVNEAYIEQIRATMEEDEYVIIACKSFDRELENKYQNITIKKIPQMLLSKCEFGRDNYNLNIIHPPVYEDEEADDE